MLEEAWEFLQLTTRWSVTLTIYLIEAMLGSGGIAIKGTTHAF